MWSRCLSAAGLPANGWVFWTTAAVAAGGMVISSATWQPTCCTIAGCVPKVGKVEPELFACLGTDLVPDAHSAGCVCMPARRLYE